MPWEGWNDTLDTRAGDLWKQGKSGTEIARVLGAPSRNAVIGGLRRLGLSACRPAKSASETRPKSVAVVERSPARLVSRKPPKVKPIPPPPPPPVARHIPFIELGRHDCRFPTNDTAPFLFCGAPVQAGSSYCCTHHEQATQKERRA